MATMLFGYALLAGVALAFVFGLARQGRPVDLADMLYRPTGADPFGGRPERSYRPIAAPPR